MLNLVFLFYNAQRWEMMRGVMKAKGLNVGETKTSKMLYEINPEALPLVKSKELQ